MKKAAVKGLIILVGVVLVCIFFSGTLHSITTAKVQMTKAKTGKLTSEITMTGELYWPSTESVFVPGLTGDTSLTVLRMCVGAGSWIKAGQVIAECEVSEADTRLASLQSDYDTRENESLELERKNRPLQLTPQQKGWYEAYRALKSARQAEQNALQELKLTAWRAGVDLAADGTLPEGTADEAALAALETLNACRESTAEAQSAFDGYNMVPISEDVISYLTRKAELQAEMADLADQMTRLRILQETAAAVTAPHDGYITAAELKAGDTLTRNTVLVQMTEDGVLPMIRLDPGTNKKSIAAGTRAELTAGGRSVTASVAEVALSAEGKPCVDVTVTREDISMLGGIPAVSETGSVTASVKWQSESSSTLIPTAALRGSEGDYYIFVTRTDDAESGTANRNARFFRISRKNVTVLGQSGSVTSVSEPLRSESIVYMEDRPLSEGCEVMPYDEK